MSKRKRSFCSVIVNARVSHVKQRKKQSTRENRTPFHFQENNNQDKIVTFFVFLQKSGKQNYNRQKDRQADIQKKHQGVNKKKNQ